MAAFTEVLTEEERAQVQSISLQCWQGAPDKGHWLQKGTLTIPTRKPEPAIKILARRKPADLLDDEEQEAKSKLLPFRKLGALVEEPEETPAEVTLIKRITATA